MEIIFATNNQHKVKEIKHLVGPEIIIRSLKEVTIFEEIPETHDTLIENAIEKAMFIYEKYGYNCFADDTGLEIDSLDGRPGVYSARYAGPACSFEDNVNKVLSELKGISNRKARFTTVIAFVENGEITTFEGSVEGTITIERKGIDGFGYDPVFLPDGYSETFAEMPLDIKNKISHRARALVKFIGYLKSKNR